MTRRLTAWMMAGALAALLFAGPAFAQSQAYTGVIEGIVQDQSGGVIPGATVTLIQTETGFERVVVTDDSGRFRARLLPVGPYEVTAEQDGFKKSTNVVRLTIGATLNIRITLELGDINEVVTVSADNAPLVETSNPLTQSMVNERAISDLPINGRDFQSFVFLTPGAVQSGRQTISLGGQKGIETNFQIDGADRNNAFFGGQSGGDRPPFTFSQEAVREFVVLSNGYSAEFGRSSAGLVNVVTKSGTNEWHGSAFYLFRSSDFLADERIVNVSADGTQTEADRERSVGDRHQFGGSFGGPIVQDRAFFFFSTEHQFFDRPLLVAFNLTDEERQFAPQALLDLEGTFQSTDDAMVYNGKFDLIVNDSHNMNFRYTFTDSEQVNGTTTGTTNDAVARNGLEENQTQQVVLNWNSILTPRAVNEFRFNYLFEDRPRSANVSDITSDVAVIGCCDLGGSFFLPIPEDDDRYQFVNNLSYNFGAHDLKFGVEYNDTGVDQIFRGNARGSFRFGTIEDLIDPATGQILDDPQPNRYRQFFGPGDLKVRIQEWAFYVQDDWKVLPNLTLNLGLRWEGQYNPDNDRPNTDFPAFSDKIVDDDNNWAPRLGFAWDPFGDGKTVIRGAAGIFYARTPTLLFSNPLRVNGEVTNGVTLQFSGDDASNLVPIRFGGDSFPGLATAFDSLQEAASLLGTDLPASGSVPFGRVNLHALDFENPESYRFNLAFEHEISTDWVAGVNWTHSQTRHAQRRVDLNLFRGEVDEFGREIFNTRDGNRPFADITTDDVRLVESSARSEYDALTLSLQKRYANRFQLQTYYTLSYNNSDDDNERSANDINGTPFQLFQDFGDSANDIRHNFVINGVIDLPFEFQVSGILTARTGDTWNPETGVDSNRDGEFDNDRPFIADCNTQIFARGIRGDCLSGTILERNAFDQPEVTTVDMRITKKFVFGETTNASAFIEFFNLFNTRNLEVTTEDIRRSDFGIPNRQGTDPFEMQIGFRFDF